ncbi:alpha/beta-Hydrolases superfamily protein [Rhynchospora pubera]|uniref:Alpha/beta-Hydrolases superfamily protein n=1 Tax=Rhynchospora pubera TaxID=906938 RepID=A0AAV8CQ08_9POAL|nr:alpha/beta-Hydrolases superfamily protein [Rhynchospora pubera]
MITSGSIFEVWRTLPLVRAFLVDRKIFREHYWRSTIQHGIRVDCTRNTHLMEKANTEFSQKIKCVDRRCIISSFSVDLLEILSKKPSMHVFFIPGNPGIVSYYRDFIEDLFENLGGNASITAISHTAQGRKAVANGRLFSLQEQIDHKVDFIEQEMGTSVIPAVLVGHSIGAYIGLEVFKRMQQKVKVYVGLYPFLTLNKDSSTQSITGMVARSPILSGAVSLLVSLIGSLPARISETLVRRLLGPSWSFTAIDATCNHLLEYHTMRNVLYMAMTEFRELSAEPDWVFLRQKKDQIAFLFGDDDHWGPLTHFEEVSRQVPGIDLSIEREGLTHGFSCTVAGSIWVARYVADVIRNKIGAEMKS